VAGAVLVLPEGVLAQQRVATPSVPTPAPPPAAEAARPAEDPPPAPPSPSSAAQPAPVYISMNQLDDSHRIGVGDVLSLRIIEDGDPPRTMPVTDSGEVEVPYIGRMKANGETPRSLATKVKGVLEKDLYHQATVLISVDSMAVRSRGKVYVVGQVRNPGAKEIPPAEKFTVSKAILAAGGMGDFAERRKVKLVRKRSPDDKDPQVTLVDVKAILEEGLPAPDPELQAEDLIIVTQRMINF